MRPNVRRLRRMFKPQKIGHTAKGVAYHIGNSYRGLRWMFRIGKRQADRDTLCTRDGVPKNSHWNRPLNHGFKDPTGHWKPSQQITKSTSAEVDLLVSREGGYVIRDTETDIRQAARMGYKVLWIEPKSWENLDNQEIWDLIASWGKKYGIKLRGYALPGNARCLPYMNRAGIPAHKLKER